MKYTDAKEMLPNAEFIYADVTQEQIDLVTTPHYVSDVAGVKILGTNEPIEGLIELLPGSVSFD